MSTSPPNLQLGLHLISAKQYLYYMESVQQHPTTNNIINRRMIPSSHFDYFVKTPSHHQGQCQWTSKSTGCLYKTYRQQITECLLLIYYRRGDKNLTLTMHFTEFVSLNLSKAHQRDDETNGRGVENRAPSSIHHNHH